MTFDIPPDLEQALQAHVKAGPHRSADEYINAAIEQFMAPDFEPDELNRLLAVGRQQIAAGRVVVADEVVRRVRSWGEARRQGK